MKNAFLALGIFVLSACASQSVRAPASAQATEELDFVVAGGPGKAKVFRDVITIYKLEGDTPPFTNLDGHYYRMSVDAYYVNDPEVPFEIQPKITHAEIGVSEFCGGRGAASTPLYYAEGAGVGGPLYTTKEPLELVLPDSTPSCRSKLVGKKILVKLLGDDGRDQLVVRQNHWVNADDLFRLKPIKAGSPWPNALVPTH